MFEFLKQLKAKPTETRPNEFSISGFQTQGAKANQEDALTIFSNEEKTVAVAAVFDGHGGFNGQIASKVCVKVLEDFAKNQIFPHYLSFSDSQWSIQLAELFDLFHQSVRKEFVKVETKARLAMRKDISGIVDKKGIVRGLDGYPMHGGTTATVCVYLNTILPRVICANVGDSNALLISCKKECRRKTKRFQHLSAHHGPDNVSEFNRIQSLDIKEKLGFIYDCSGVCRAKCPSVFLKNGQKNPDCLKGQWKKGLKPSNVRLEPGMYCISPPNVDKDVTCIAMTRSIGDFYAHQYGLSHEPSISFTDLKKDEEYFISVGSDGIWDCWKWDEFSTFLVKSKLRNIGKIDKVVKEVVLNSVHRAGIYFGKNTIDDASLTLIHVDPLLKKRKSGFVKKRFLSY